mmetsp:Transcript_3955/g.5983  ORF Transcript_3955/g.5983 Transcript_3955/m.5983 type:complete len:286 (+) Transcript_3955:439-1296(+)
MLDYDSKVSEGHMRAEALKKELSALNSKVEKSFKDHLEGFRNMEIQLSAGQQNKSCVWLSENKYVKACERVFEIQKAYANFVSTFWKEITELETKRIKAVKTAMSKYIEIHKKVYSTDSSSVEKALSEVSEDLTGVLSADKLLTQDEKPLLENIGEGTEPLEVLLMWELEKPPRTNLVVKQGVLLRETGVFSDWKECFVVLTQDRFLHLFKSGDLDLVEPYFTLVLTGARVLVPSSEEESYFEVVETKPQGFLRRLSANKRVVLKSSLLEEIHEWAETIKLLTEY